jgi:mannose-6-phosphate isomerase-like protein (cupin superfamily)
MQGYVGSIERLTLSNDNFLQVLFTGNHTQLILMCFQPGDETGVVRHPVADQFFRIEEGKATIIIGDNEKHQVEDGDAVIVPAGIDHNVINTSKTAKLKLYTIYSSPLHHGNAMYKTRADAEDAEAQDIYRFSG